MVEQTGTLGLINWELKIKGPKTKSYRDTKWPGKAGFVRLTYAVDKRNDPKVKRDLLLLHLPYDTALRRSEVCALTFPEDVIWENGEPTSIRILGEGRTEKEILVLPKRTRKFLPGWLEARGTWKGPLFVNSHHDVGIRGKRLTPDGLYYVVKELGRKTDQTVRPHGLRHTSITKAVRRSQAVGMDVTRVLKF
jgi:integrase/recombinase XerC